MLFRSTFAIMGESYARTMTGITKPAIGLIKIGSEEEKGRDTLKIAAERLREPELGLDFRGYVEGNDIAMGAVDVIVTDGFTGNIALKTGEGTASLIREFLEQAFKATPLSRIAALLALTSLRRLSKRIDPRRVNGGVFLGLNGTVVKSHGSADALGVASAVQLAFTLGQAGFSEKLAARVAQATLLAQHGLQDFEKNGQNA